MNKFTTPEERAALKEAIVDFYGVESNDISTPVKRMRNMKAKTMYHRIIDDDVVSMREEEKKKEA